MRKDIHGRGENYTARLCQDVFSSIGAVNLGSITCRTMDVTWKGSGVTKSVSSYHLSSI